MGAIVAYPASLTYSPKGRVEARYSYARQEGARIESVWCMLLQSDTEWTRRLGLDCEHYLQWRRDNGYQPPRVSSSSSSEKAA